MENSNSKNKKSISILILIVYSISLFVPMLWSLITSLKSKYDFRSNIFGLPKEWMWENYITAFIAYKHKVGIGPTARIVYLEEMLLNSLLYSVGCAVIQAFVTCLVAYTTQKFSHFIESKIVYNVVIVVMILPIVGSQPSELALARTLGLYDKMWGMWLMRFNFLGMYYLVFYAIFKGIPKDFADAAYIDGASEWTVMFEIMLPVAQGTLMTVILLNFIGYWNDYQAPLLYIPSYPTMALGLYLFCNSVDNELATVPMKLTGCMIMVLPILIVFLIFQNSLIGTISVGGLKE